MWSLRGGEGVLSMMGLAIPSSRGLQKEVARQLWPSFARSGNFADQNKQAPGVFYNRQTISMPILCTIENNDPQKICCDKMGREVGRLGRQWW